jgi:hypothetical protein
VVGGGVLHAGRESSGLSVLPSSLDLQPSPKTKQKERVTIVVFMSKLPKEIAALWRSKIQEPGSV